MNDFMDDLKETAPKPIWLDGKPGFLVQKEDFHRLYLRAAFPSLLDHWSGYVGTPPVWRHYDLFLIQHTRHWIVMEHSFELEPHFALLHKQLEELGS